MLNHIRRFYIEKLIDGSTFIGWFDLDFDVRIRKKVRMVNIQCHTPNTQKGADALKFVETIINDRELYCKTVRDHYRKYATLLGILYVKIGDEYINLNDELLKRGFVTAYTKDESDKDNETV